MLGYNRTITRTNINVLINIGPGAGGGRKRRGKKGKLPNTFDDDCMARRGGRGRGAVTPLYGSDRNAPPDRVGFLRVLNSGDSTRPIETLRYPEIGVRVTGSAMFFSFCGDVIDLTR